jgi:hypothetical protein
MSRIPVKVGVGLNESELGHGPTGRTLAGLSSNSKSDGYIARRLQTDHFTGKRPTPSAVVGYHRVLEDGPEVCSSENVAEHSEHRQEYSDSDRYTTDVLNENSNPVFGAAIMTTDQRNQLRK